VEKRMTKKFIDMFIGILKNRENEKQAIFVQCELGCDVDY